MTRSEHKYNDATARFYDVVYDKLLDKAQLHFYLEKISEAKGSVLELGAGTGRIFIPALEAGADIYGIDQSDVMLKKLKEKLHEEQFQRITLNDSRDFDLGRKFELIIAPFRMFSHMITIEDQLKTFKCVYDHLADGGKFIFDVFVPDVKLISMAEREVTDFDDEFEPGNRLRRTAVINNDYINQLINVQFKYSWNENGSEFEEMNNLPLRYFFRFEIENLISRSELRLEKLYGDFKEGELTNASKDFVVICLK